MSLNIAIDFFLYNRVEGLPFNAISNPSSTKAFFIRSIVRIPIFRTLLICSFVCLSSEYSPVSQFNKTSALRIFDDLCEPFLIMERRISLSSWVNVTIYLAIVFFDKNNNILRHFKIDMTLTQI